VIKLQKFPENAGKYCTLFVKGVFQPGGRWASKPKGKAVTQLCGRRILEVGGWKWMWKWKWKWRNNPKAAPQNCEIAKRSSNHKFTERARECGWLLWVLCFYWPEMQQCSCKRTGENSWKSQCLCACTSNSNLITDLGQNNNNTAAAAAASQSPISTNPVC